MLDPDPDDAGWMVAAFAFLLNLVQFGVDRTEGARNKRIREINNQIDKRFAGENGFDVKLARVEERVNGVYERLGSLDRKFDTFVGARLDEDADREQ